MSIPRILAAVLGASSLCCAAATYQLTYVAPAHYQWEFNGLNRHGAVTGQTTIDGTREVRAHVFENSAIRLLKPVGDYNQGAAINDRGDVAGQCEKNDHTRACIWKAGGSVEVFANSLGGAKRFVEVADINNARQVAGSAKDESGAMHAFRFADGVMQDLGSLGGWAYATGINKLGHVAGYSSVSNFGPFHAFIHDGTQMKDLGTLADNAFAEALNDHGVAVGRADVNGGERHAVMFKDGQIIDLGTPGGDSEAWDVNNHEVVVGGTRSAPYVAFVHRNGRMIDLNTRLDPVSGAGWHLLSARKINDRGQIVAIAERAGDIEEHVVLLTPLD